MLGLVLLVLLAGGCNLGAASPNNVDGTNLKIALIGDSVAADLAKALRSPHFVGPSGVNWAITAQPGAGWGEGEDAQGNWPLSVVHGDSVARRVRAAAGGRPSAIAIELGTNDALRASFAYSLNNGAQLLARFDGTDDNIRSIVKVASSLSRCVVLISPSYYPTAAFDEEQNYAFAAFQLRSVLMKEVSRSSHRSVVLADWAALSSTHRRAAGSSQNWFTADGLHPNAIGLRVLANLIVRTARSCPL